MKGAIVVEESDAGGGRNAADATGSGDTLVGEIVTGGLASVVIGILLLLPVSELRQRRESGQ